MRYSTLLLLALILAACGGAGTADETVQPVDLAPDSSPATTVAPTTTTEESSDTTTTGATPTTEAGETSETAEAVELDRLNGPFPDSMFPDAVVEDLSGGQVNVRFLGAESQPVLLWFYAPH